MVQPAAQAALAWMLAGLLSAVGGAASAQSQEPPPILVTGMVHIDPLPTPPDTNATIAAYNQHRAALQWYVGLAASIGLRMSAQMTGPYAEACVRQGDAADFSGFMPGQTHSLGTHMHANVKRARPYGWRLLPEFAYGNPDSVRRVLLDNVPYVNTVFTGCGVDPALANRFLHGSHAAYEGMDEDLWCRPPGELPYDNCYTMAAGLRGQPWLYLGGFLTEPAESPDTSYVKLSEVGGIIGFDQPHGPEGMVWGTVPYQKRDFLRTYLEWREDARRGVSTALRHFMWMVHPYQLLPGIVGTDGRSPRVSIQELVAWLGANFVERTDETTLVMARYANAAEIEAAYAAWRASHPTEHANLQATLAAGGRPLWLPAICDRLDTTYYAAALTGGAAPLALHALTDRDSGLPVWVAWSRSGEQPVAPLLSGALRVLHGDGTEELVWAEDLTVGPEPVVLEPASANGVDDAPVTGLPHLGPVHPNPFSPSASIGFETPEDGRVTLGIYSLRGALVRLLVDETLPAGRHQAVWDGRDAAGRDAASGGYFALLQAGGAADAVRMTLVR